MKSVLIALSLAAALTATLAGAQAQAPGAKPPAAPKPTAEAQPPGTPPPALAPGYSYDPSGRRDPFVSLLGRGGGDARPGANRPSGVAGFLINEVSIKGIVKDRTGFLAMIQGTDNKTYVIRPGDKLLDGSVKSVVADAVVFAQDVNDPLSLVKQREVRKPLRSEGR
jgi:hypothetical protein